MLHVVLPGLQSLFWVSLVNMGCSHFPFERNRNSSEHFTVRPVLISHMSIRARRVSLWISLQIDVCWVSLFCAGKYANLKIYNL